MEPRMTAVTTALPAHGAALIEASLEAVAASGIDIVPEFFARFFAHWPEQCDNFQRPLTSQGEMVTEMLDFLIAQASGEGWTVESFESCMDRHHSYADIDPADFAQSLAILVETLAAVAGPGWKPEFTLAWSANVESLTGRTR